MGNCQAKDHENPRIATLNFSGICLSPFQYHDCSIQKDLMSSTFDKIMKKYIDQPNFSWNVGRIDLKMQKQRYTPIYRKDVCIVNDKLVNREEFQQLWEEQFQKNKKILKESIPSAEQRLQARLFDWIAYQTFLNQVYKQNQKHLINLDKIKQFPSQKFKKFLQYWHSQPYLDNIKKINLIIEFININSLDLLFLQQAQIRQNFNWDQILPQNFNVQSRQDSQSIIIYRKSRFPVLKKQKNRFYEIYKNVINYNKDTCFVKTNNNILLVSAHFTSKSHNLQQSQQMRKSFLQILKQNPNIQIICGVDSNHFIKEDQFNADQGKKLFHIYPSVQSQATTSKKRTCIQLQTNKSNLIVIEPKDHLISTIPYIFKQNPKSPWVGMLSGHFPGDKVYLPSKDHPFDHFIIYAQIQNLKQEPK